MSGRRLRHDRRAENRRGGARPAQGAAGAGKRAPVGKCRALGEGVHGGRQGHDHAARTAKTTATSCWIPSRPPKKQFTDKEYEWLKESATEISNIENKLTELEEKYPEIMQKSMDGDMSMPAGSDTSTPPDDGSMQKFPAFEGKDLDGNTVKSDELFSGNAVTVVNFWFTTCNPCVGELAELDALNKELAEKGGSLIGVNTFTLDGDEAAISEAKDVLAKKGATYQNVYFDSDGEAGKFTTNIFAYPTTYVVDRSGNIVGEPIVGAITEKKQAETLQKLIEQALAADMG